MAEKGSDCIEEKDCEKCREDLISRHHQTSVDMGRRIGDLEKDFCTITKPEIGALAMMHEKINKRPTWMVFWSIIMAIFALLSILYTHTRESNKEIIGLQMEVVRKADLMNFENRLDKRLEKLELNQERMIKR